MGNGIRGVDNGQKAGMHYYAVRTDEREKRMPMTMMNVLPKHVDHRHELCVTAMRKCARTEVFPSMRRMVAFQLQKLISAREEGLLLARSFVVSPTEDMVQRQRQRRLMMTARNAAN